MIAVAEQLNTLPEIPFGAIVAKGSNGVEPEASLTHALNACLSEGIEVVSMLSERVEIRVPSHLAVISPLQQLHATRGGALARGQ